MKYSQSFRQFAMAIGLSIVSTTVMAVPPDVGLVVKDPTLIPAPFVRTKPQTVTVDLEAIEVLADIDGSGQKALVWTYNGTIPGPLIRVMEGDVVTINLTNTSSNDRTHNIDLHAVLGPGGGASVTGVSPGETKSLTFTATRQGAYIYHCAGEGIPWTHIAQGMFGMIVVEPKGGLPKVNKEFYVGQIEWYRKSDSTGVSVIDDDQAETEIPDFWTFNGHKKALQKMGALTAEMRAKQGDIVRFFFVNGGPNKGANFHIIGTIFDKTYQGHFTDVLRNQETEYVAPGAAAVFELEAKVPGRFMLVDHALYRAKNGAVGFLEVDPVGAWPDAIYSPQPSPAQMLTH